MILLIDNYDSFSYNLVQFFGTVEPDIKVVRNDECTIDEIRAMKPTHIPESAFETVDDNGARAVRKMPVSVRK